MESKILNVLYDFKGRNELELDIRIHDEVCLIESVHGWAWGQNLRTKCYGWYP